MDVPKHKGQELLFLFLIIVFHPNLLYFLNLVFLLANPNKKVRRNGKITMGDWCKKENIPIFTLANVSELIAYATAGE